MEEQGKTWTGSPLDLGGVMDPNGVEEVVIEFENGDTDVFRSRLRERFYSYELHDMAVYLDSIGYAIRKGLRR